MSTQSRDFRGVIRPVGAVVSGIGVVMALCAGVGFAWDRLAPNPDRPQGGAWELGLSAAIVHGDDVIIPHGKDVVHPGDRVILMTTKESRATVERLFRPRGE